MSKNAKKFLAIGISLAIMAMGSPLTLASEGTPTDGNTAAGNASSHVVGDGITAVSIGAEIQGGSQNVAVGSSIQVINGRGGNIDGYGALAVGGDGNTAIGANSQVVGGNNLRAIGFGAFSGYGDNNTAIGSHAYAGGASSTSQSSYNTAIGNYAEATGNGSVALGAGSVASQAATVSVGNSEYQRRIVNLAPGVYDTDAVNMSQLHSVDSKVDRVGATAAAFSALAPLPYDPKQPTQYSAGIGTYRGTNAVAFGAYHYTQPDVMINAAIGISDNGWERNARFGISWRTGSTKPKELAPTVEPKESLDERVKKILSEMDQTE